MPLVGDICGSNGIDLANESGSDNGNKTTLAQLLMNLVTSGNEKHVKLASDLLDLDLIKGNVSDNLDLNDSDKNEQEQELTIDNNYETDMEWTTVKPKNKRVRSNSNDSEKIMDITVSPSKKQNLLGLTTKMTNLPEIKIMTIIESKVKVNQTKILRQNQELGLGMHSVKIQY